MELKTISELIVIYCSVNQSGLGFCSSIYNSGPPSDYSFGFVGKSKYPRNPMVYHHSRMILIKIVVCGNIIRFLNINLGSAYCSIVLTCCRATVYTRDQCSSFALSAPAMAPAMSKCPWRKVQGKRQENIDVIEIQSSVIDSYSNLRIEMWETKKWGKCLEISSITSQIPPTRSSGTFLRSSGRSWIIFSREVPPKTSHKERVFFRCFAMPGIQS